MRTESRELLAVGILGANSRGSASRLGDRIEVLLRHNGVFSARPARRRLAGGTLILAALGFTASPRWILFEAPAFAQQAGKPAFDAASVKPNTSIGGRITFSPPAGGRFNATNVTPRMLIELAYNLPGFELSGEPAWIDSLHYDVAAKAADSSITEDQFRLMLRTLLEDRFALKVHHETREVPVYALLPGNRQFRLPAADDDKCAAFRQAQPAGSTSPANPDICGLSIAPNRLDVHRISMRLFAGALSSILGRPVVDKTGYPGTFSVHLEFDQSNAATISAGNTEDVTRPSIFAALREQMGLRLESQKGPALVFVIDHAEKPGAN